MSILGARLGVDIGGTFTDIVLEQNGRRYSAKVLTTYSAPEDAIVEGMHRVCFKAGIPPSSITQIIHGTTLATNALIERRGAKTALITTQGFRDVIEMRTESRFEQYDLNMTVPLPLLPRNQRYTLRERIDARGQVLVPLDSTQVEELAEELATAAYESVAIGFLHSYVNGRHEQIVRDILEKRLPGITISLSSEVSPQMREYERFNTTIANSYIKPLMKSYLVRLKGRLEKEGTKCPIFLMHSGGGIISLESASEFPVRLVESGPAGGAVFAADIAARHGLEKVLSFDMGGTTAKICLIKNYTPKTARVFEVARTYRFKKGSGMPISIPVIDMVEIGAGGGSLAHVDSMNQIRVGPESAASEPGPACYGRGGIRPAVTDADVALGKIDPDNFLGGTIALHASESRKALDAEIGAKLGMEPLESAWGVAEVVDENMANAARVHAVENGEDLSDYTMIAFGGAAPLHAGRLCEKLGISRCLVPPGAGVGSAIGFLRAPFSFESNRTLFMRLDHFDPEQVKSLFAEMEQEAIRVVRSCGWDGEIISAYKVYMRYSGQGWEIPVVLTADEAKAGNPAIILKRFEEEYVNLFGRLVRGLRAEITVWSVNAHTPPHEVTRVRDVDATESVSTERKRTFFDAGLRELVDGFEVSREKIATGGIVTGPGVITEEETTVVLPTSRWAMTLPDGCIDIRLVETEAETSKVEEVKHV